MVNLTIDGRAIQAKPGSTILEVAKENGIFIPYLCYHPALKPIGSCRICVVDVKPGPPRPIPACATTVTEGMEVVTTTPKLTALRQELMKLVLINHALECPICDKGGECELQDLTHALAVPTVDLDAVKLPPNPDYVSQMVERHPDRCVTCGRCVRVCRDRVGAMAINFTLRGYFTELASGAQPLDCEFCGSCIDICPVGALINKQFKYRARAWEVAKTEMACPFCGGGCTYQVHTKDGKHHAGGERRFRAALRPGPVRLAGGGVGRPSQDPADQGKRQIPGSLLGRGPGPGGRQIQRDGGRPTAPRRFTASVRPGPPTKPITPSRNSSGRAWAPTSWTTRAVITMSGPSRPWPRSSALPS